MILQGEFDVDHVKAKKGRGKFSPMIFFQPGSHHSSSRSRSRSKSRSHSKEKERSRSKSAEEEEKKSHSKSPEKDEQEEEADGDAEGEGDEKEATPDAVNGDEENGDSAFLQSLTVAVGYTSGDGAVRS